MRFKTLTLSCASQAMFSCVIHLLSVILKEKLGFKLVDKSCNNYIVRFRRSMLNVGIN